MPSKFVLAIFNGGHHRMIRKRLTYANTAATLALLFAMTGGAYAANHYLINSTKQISPKVLKALKGNSGANGPAGPAGSAGPAGVAGPKGETGAGGPAGPAGPAGTSVTAKALSASEAACGKLGGGEFKAGSTTTFACNGEKGKEGKEGKEGPAGPEGVCSTSACTLPKGVTETGTWMIRGTDSAEEELKFTNISFPIPLKAKPTNVLIGIKGAATVECPGSVEKPEAIEGKICFYEGATLVHKGGLKEALIPLDLKGSTTVETSGALIAMETKKPTTVGEEVSAEGTWAVTAN
ncbi:MAG TPA: collagen-like protein [Solirubrobacteraceae bacterium]|jgi:hypothetical protein|nr:collagen-like protein [Solirubrobacteraceae bacterium]